MSQHTEKKYKVPDWPDDNGPQPTETQPRRKRRAAAEPEDLWGKIRFRAGRKSRCFGRRCRRVIREARANRCPESHRGPLQCLLMVWGLLPAMGSHLRERML